MEQLKGIPKSETVWVRYKDGEKLYDWANQGEAPAPKKEIPKFSEPEYNEEDTLKAIVQEIISYCTKLGGIRIKSI